MQKLGLKPSIIVVDSSGVADLGPALERSLQSLEKALQPIMAESVSQFAKKTPVLRPDLLASPENRKRM
jgi:hypothetical protein